MQLIIDFGRLFLLGIYFISPILLIFAFIVFALGQIVGRMESWNKFDAFYWSFITAFTVGYGDIRPVRKGSKMISMFIALIGIIFTGIIVSVNVVALTKSFEENTQYEQVLKAHHLNQYSR